MESLPEIMEIASNKGVIADASTPAGRAGMSESEWREAIKFDSTDTGWVIMSIGMAIVFFSRCRSV
ncbi:inner membrane transport YhaO domain protein [Shigella dysenteriae 225-75]|nr:inner membrane transport YhaO domain protein [Shigella dysenteriae 225-75]